MANADWISARTPGTSQVGNVRGFHVTASLAGTFEETVGDRQIHTIPESEVHPFGVGSDVDAAIARAPRKGIAGRDRTVGVVNQFDCPSVFVQDQLADGEG